VQLLLVITGEGKQSTYYISFISTGKIPCGTKFTYLGALNDRKDGE